MKPPKFVVSFAVLGLSLGQFAANAQDNKPLKLTVLTNNASDFWTIARAGCEQAQKDVPNISVDFRIPSDGTAAEQTRIFERRFTQIGWRDWAACGDVPFAFHFHRCLRYSIASLPGR